MAKFVVVDHSKLSMALCEAAGVEPTYVRRIVLDLEVGRPGKLYLDTFSDSEILDVGLEAGIEVAEVVATEAGE